MVLALTLGLLGGCGNLGYYYQSARGQFDLWHRAESITTLIDDRRIAQPLKDQLATVLRIREFASRELSLPDNGSYRNYADVQRPFVIWNVFATPEFSITPTEWCFPVAGCVSYRGYFAQMQAENFAAELRGQGYDVFVGGVPAYSTLGWFDDPVLNTFIHYPATELARLIFHELAHQVVYVADDSVFNESFAVAVEEEGLRRWLEQEGSTAQRVAFKLAQQRRAEFAALILSYRGELETLYDTALAETGKRTRKAVILRALNEDYQTLKTSWGGFTGYDRWLAQAPNNATLASIAIYTQLVPAFQTLLTRYRGDLPRFYSAVESLGNLPEGERLVELRRLFVEHSDGQSRRVILKFSNRRSP